MIRRRRDLIIGTGYVVGHRSSPRFERCLAVWAGPVFVRFGARPSVRWMGWRRAEWCIRRLETVSGFTAKPLDLRAVYVPPPLTVEQATSLIAALGL